jgi:transcriptional regulator with XRE-family HTH domain
MLRLMKAIHHIRKDRFGLTQVEFAKLAGVAQTTVSRWEAGELDPSLEDMARIRAAAFERSIKWQDKWFFTDIEELSAAAR